MRKRWWVLPGMLVAALLLYLWIDDAPDPRSARTDDVPPAGEPTRAESPAPSNSESVPTDSLSFQVRDLADGRPLPDIRIEARADGRAVSATTDPEGRVRLPRHAADISVRPPWSIVPSLDESTDVIWVHGWIEIDGVVKARGDAEEFSATRTVLQTLIDRRNAPEGFPEQRSLRRLLAGHSRGKPAADGRFGFTVPRLYGITVAATLTGWKSARQTIDVSRGTKTEYVELALERALRIRGVARSSDGEPLRNLQLACLSLTKTSPAEATADYLRLLKPNGGFGSAIDVVAGEARVSFTTFAYTDGEGRFELPVEFHGEVLVVAFPFGHKPVYHDFGLLGADDVTGAELVAERVTNPTFVRVVANGIPFESGKLSITDLTLKDGDAQPGTQVTLDSESRASTDWLIVGRRFYFMIGTHHGHRNWDGRETLDVAKDLLPPSELPR